MNKLGRRRHKVRTTRVVVISTDPGLYSAELSTHVRVGRVLHQCPMERENIVQNELALCRELIDSEFHRLDIADHCLCGDVVYRIADLLCCFCSRESANSDFQAFYARRGY